MNNADMPAMPMGPSGTRGQFSASDLEGWAQQCRPAFGVTKREYFAGLAMQGALASDVNFNMDKYDIADQAVQHADALLAALEKEPAQ